MNQDTIGENNISKLDLSLDNVNIVSKGMPGGFFIYKADDNEELIAWNDVVVSIFGCKNDDEFKDLVGSSFKGMVHCDDLRVVYQSIIDQVSSNEHKFDHVEYRITKKNGDIAWVDDFGRLVDTTEFGLVYFVFIRDITEQKRIQAENLRIQLELEIEKQIINTRNEFLFNVSHDIRTPMNAITGYTELALNSLEDAAEVKDCLEKIRISGGHMMSLIDDLLEMSELYSGNIELHIDQCSIKQELTTATEMLRELADEKSITLSLNIDTQNDSVLTDAQRLRRIMCNLIENGIKYTNKGGSVTVTVKEGPLSGSGYARYDFTVTDTGIGMSEKFLKRIFGAFEREETSTKSGASGIGLGLSITKNLVDRLGGTISVTSKKCEGSSFTVSLPLRLSGIEKAGNKESNKNVRAEGQYRILQVEDLEVNRKMTEKILTKAGFIVESVCDGSDAVSEIKELPEGYYDLILMDIQMPVMNGFEATRLIRSMGRKDTDTVPIIALSANARDIDKKRSIECGMNTHIAKPFSVQDLISTINEEIRKRPI